jgi:hypothetical protein
MPATSYITRLFGGTLVVNVAPHGYGVTIGGNAVFVISGTLLIDSAIGRRSTASFQVLTDTSTHFQQYQQVQIFDQNGVLAFSGYIQNPKEQKPGFQDMLVHEISCIDQHFLADKRRVAKSYTNTLASSIVQDLLASILSQEGVTVGQISDQDYGGLAPSPTLYPSTTLYPKANIGVIPSAVFAYCTVAEAMDALVKADNAAGIPYYWQIDQNKLLWFVPYTAVTGPTVDGTQVDSGQLSGVIPSVTRANPTYRNTQYILGGMAQTVIQDRSFKGDNSTTTFIMPYELATVPTITVNSNPVSVGINGVETGKDWYWNKGSPNITQDSSATKLISTDTLRVYNWYGQYPTIIVSANSAQVSYEQSLDGTSGIVEEVETDSSINSLAGGLAEASALLTRYGVQGQIFEFATQQSGFTQGQLIPVTYAPLGFYGAQMLIEEVSASDQTESFNVWYTVKAVLGPYDVTWQSFFGELLATAQQTNSINVGVSQQLLLAASGSVTLSPTMTGIAMVTACPLPSTTLYPSPTLYPC